MSLLFKNLRVHQIFGANTDVGKTLLTSALVRASATAGKNVFYLKPVSTGRIEDADDGYIKRFSGPYSSKISTECLFRFDEPVSPHLAARLAIQLGKRVGLPKDNHILTAISSYIRERAAHSKEYSHLYSETAGGVHSPTLTGTSQLDSYRPLFLPTILVGDSRLGGISATISSYESLVIRGYTVDAVILFRDGYYRNWEYLEPYFAERGVHLSAVEHPPEKHADPTTNHQITEQYYQKIVPPSQGGDIFRLLSHLDHCHERRITELDSMPRRTLNSIWWPFVQHSHFTTEKDVTVIDSAHSDTFSVYNGHKPNRTYEGPHASLLEPQFDGSASWWTQGIGHAHPSLTLAAARAAGRYGHVMFPQATHLPALKLAERLIQSGPGKGWASRAFFSDDGSTGMEVAIKMALRAFAVRESGGMQNRIKRRDLGVLGLKGSYHGDTIGAMDACEEGVYTSEWHEAKGYWFDPPTVSIRKGKTVISLPPSIAKVSSDIIEMESLGAAYDLESRLNTSLANIYRSYIERTLLQLRQKPGRALAALVLEPIVMGAGGMIFVDPLFQRVLVEVVRSSSSPTPLGEWSGMPVIFDEVFVGFYRLGLQSTIPLLGINPDISVHAKILTGGLLPLAVTLASDSIFQAFYSEKKVDALLHGHSYTAYPVGCEVANETLSILDKLAGSDAWESAKQGWSALEHGSNTHPAVAKPKDAMIWSLWDRTFIEKVSKLDIVSEVMALGTVLSIKIADDASGYQSHSAQNLLASIKEAVHDGSTSAILGGVPFGVNYRTLGDVAYFMLSLNSPSDTIRAVEDKILQSLQKARS